MQALDLLFPPRCVDCGRGGHWFCPTCAAKIEPAPAWDARLEPLAGLWVAGLYDDPLRLAIQALKYQGRRQVARPLGHLLAATYRQQMQGRDGQRFDAALPVPLHPRRQAERGFNQSALVGKTLLLVDDVCTTGTTLIACAEALCAAGAREVWALTVARPSF